MCYNWLLLIILLSMLNPSVNFTHLAFKELLSMDKTTLDDTFKVTNSSTLSQDQLLQGVWNYCVKNKLSPLNLEEEIAIEDLNTDLYLTGYDGIVLTKRQAFDLTSLLIKDYKGVVNLNLLLTGKSRAISPYVTTELKNYCFTSFLALFTCFGLHLKENKQLLLHYLNKLNIPFTNPNAEYFFDTSKIEEYQLLNLVLDKLRKGNYECKPFNYNLSLELFRRSLIENKEYNLIARLLGVQPNSLRGCETKSFSIFILERFISLLEITDAQLIDTNFTVALSDELKEFIRVTPTDETIITPRLSVETSKVSEVLNFLYYIVIDYIGGNFLEKNGVDLSSIKRTLRAQSNGLNFCYKLLMLLGLEKNDKVISILFENDEDSICEPSEIEEKHLEKPNEHTPIQALGVLNSFPQLKPAFYKMLDLSIDEDGNEKPLPANYPSYLHKKIKDLFCNTIPTNVCIVTQLLDTDKKIFKDEQIISLAIGQAFSVATDFEHIKSLITAPTYVYQLSHVGNLELQLISIDGSSVIYHDKANESIIMYQQDFGIFQKYINKLIFVLDVDYI